MTDNGLITHELAIFQFSLLSFDDVRQRITFSDKFFTRTKHTATELSNDFKRTNLRRSHAHFRLMSAVCVVMFTLDSSVR